MPGPVTVHARRAWLAPSRFCAFVLFIALTDSGCAKYQPEPLTDAAVDRALTVSASDLERLRPPADASGQTVPFDLRDGLSPDEAATLAVAISPTLRAERSRFAVGAAQLMQAGILPNPVLSLSLEPVVGGNTVDTTAGYGFGLDWEITALIAHDAKVAAARAGLASVRLDVAWKEWQAAQAARVAVFDLFALQDQLAAAREVSGRLDENLDTIRGATDKGLKTIVDLGAAEAASHDAKAIVLGQERELAHQLLAMKRAVGLPPGHEVSAQQGAALPARLDLPAADTFLQGLETRRLDLVALRRAYDSQESALRAAVLAQFPKISFGLHPASDTTNVRTFGFGLSIDLPVFDRNQGVIGTETATRQQLYNEYIGRVFEARSDVATALADIRSLNAEIAEAEAAVPSLQRLVDAYREAAGARNADILSYYTAWNSLAQKRIDIVKLKQLLVQNAVMLELASGQLLPALRPSATQPASRPAPPPAGVNP